MAATNFAVSRCELELRTVTRPDSSNQPTFGGSGGILYPRRKGGTRKNLREDLRPRRKETQTTELRGAIYREHLSSTRESSPRRGWIDTSICEQRLRELFFFRVILYYICAVDRLVISYFIFCIVLKVTSLVFVLFLFYLAGF